MVLMDNITTIFKEKKLKLTPQRIAIYKYLKSTKSHPSAEVIYKAIQEDLMVAVDDSFTKLSAITK